MGGIRTKELIPQKRALNQYATAFRFVDGAPHEVIINTACDEEGV